MNASSCAVEARAHAIETPTAFSPVQTGHLVQLKGWPTCQWAEVIMVVGQGASGPMYRLVRYTPKGNARYTVVISAQDISASASKLDIPPMDFVTGEVDLAGGKLGVVRRRWPTLANPALDIHLSTPERFH